MPRPLPPLNGLRAFEAAARTLSFTRAAAELNVTQAAVSHRIKGLEDRLGVPLFRRLNRRLLLTDAGQALHPPVSRGLAMMTDALDRLARDQDSGLLTVSTMPSFAALWLVPRLGRFQTRRPDIDVRLATSDQLVDFARDDVDIGIRWGAGKYPGLAVTRLMGEEIFPVCSPALLEKGPPIETPADLARHTLLHDTEWDGWTIWLAGAGIAGLDLSATLARGPRFSYSDLMLRAAVAGVGVAMGRRVIVADDLAAGRLVRPLDITVPVADSYFMVSSEAGAGRAKVRAFRDWLLEETAPLSG